MRDFYKSVWLGGKGMDDILHSCIVRCTAFSLARIMADKNFAENARCSIDEVQTIIITKVKNEPDASGQ